MILIEIVVDEESAPSGTLNVNWKSVGNKQTEKELRMHDLLKGAYKLIMESEGRAGGAMTMVETRGR